MTSERTVLIIEDNEIQQDMLKTVIEQDGFRAVVASNGSDGLARAREFTPDVILLDIMMPDMDGFEVCERLRADPMLAYIPVIMLTALDDRDSRLRGIKAGADDFISKNFDFIELRARIRTTARLNRYRQLVAEKEKFEWVVQHADDGYLIMDENSQVLYANNSAYLFLHLTPDSHDPIPQTFIELARAHYTFHQDEIWDNWPEPMPDGSPRYLVQPETKLSHAFWLQVDVSNAISATDNMYTIRLRDVTEQKALHHNMQGFHSMISHKFRTPLNTMMTATELMLRHADKMTSEEIMNFSAVTLSSMKRLHHSIEDVLQYANLSKSEDHSIKEFALTQLPSILETIATNLSIAAIAVPDIKSLNGIKVKLSQKEIELILWEVLDNAKKFHPQQDPTITVIVFSTAGNVHIQINNNGLTLSPMELIIMTPKN